MASSIEGIKNYCRGTNESAITTSGLLIAIGVVYFLVFAVDPLHSLFSLQIENLSTWILYGPAVMSGEWYRLFTSLFIHFHLAHLGSNMLFLAIFGLRYEDLDDSRFLLAVFIVSGLAGNLVTIIIMPSMISAGASGAIFGVLGALIVVLRKHYPKGLKTGLFFAFIFFTITIASDTNVMAHFGGLVTGFVMQLAQVELVKRKKRRKRRRAKWSSNR